MLVLLAIVAAAGDRSARAQPLPPNLDQSRFEQRRIIIGQPVQRNGSDGELTVEPNIAVAGNRQPVQVAQRQELPTPPLTAPQNNPPPLPPPVAMPGPQYEQSITPTFDDPFAESLEATSYFERPSVQRLGESLMRHLRSSPWQRPLVSRSRDQGLGHERVMLAPSEIDITQPLNNLRIREVNYWRWHRPDRAEFYWAKPSSLGGIGPAAVEHYVDSQELRILMEAGTPKFSVGTEIPLRWVDPVVNDNTGGMSDMTVTTKGVLLDGENLQLTQITRTFIPTGSVKKGLGTGHASLEPGLLARYRWSPSTYFHSELKYWFAMGGNPNHSGQVLRLGQGISRIWYESDTFAVLPTLEFISMWVADGQQTDFPTTNLYDIASIPVMEIHPGMRFAWDSGGDAGLLEWGIHGGVAVTKEHFSAGQLRVEVRVSY